MQFSKYSLKSAPFVWGGIFLVLGIVTAQAAYCWVLSPWLETFLQEDSPQTTFGQWLHLLYPRLAVEKQRLPAAFFLEKAQQVFWRGNLLVLLLYIGVAHYYTNEGTSRVWEQFWGARTSAVQVKRLTQLFYVGVFLFTKDWYFYVTEYTCLVSLYKPYSFYALFSLPFPSPMMLNILWAGYVVALVAVCLWYRPVWATAVAGGLFFVIQGYLYAFEKISHAYATMGYALLVLPFVVAHCQHALCKGEATQSGWGVRLIQVSVAIAYVQSGLEKLLASGLAWDFSVWQNVFEAQISWETLAQWPIGSAWTWLIVLFQCSFPLAVWCRGCQVPYLLAGALFHASVFAFTGIGAWFHPWVFLYLWWIPSFVEKRR